MLYREIIAVFIHKYVLCVQSEFFNVKPVGAHSNRLGMGELSMATRETIGIMGRVA